MFTKVLTSLQGLPRGNAATKVSFVRRLAGYHFEMQATTSEPLAGIGQFKALLRRFMSPSAPGKNELHAESLTSCEVNPKGWEPCEWVDLDTLTEDLVRFGGVND
jgi:hypothetical protein